MISLLVTLEVAPDRVEEFIAYIKEEAADARTKEPGCVRFEISQSVEQANLFTLTEGYTDLAALEDHRLTPHFLLFRERVADGLILSKSSVCGTVIDA
jgi:(4S)-4-hydroxy-5-phosphonooxypentane-2,3-dione isomerase